MYTSFPSSNCCSYPGHKQAVRDVALLDVSEIRNIPSLSTDSDQPQGPILFSASDDASIRSFTLRLQDAEAVLSVEKAAALPAVHIAPSSESSEAQDVASHVELPTEPSYTDSVTKPILEWTTGMVMNSASGTWPNNLQGLAKLIVDGVQL